ncbi:MAG: hypothetical protein GF346_05180, partial [Candidatus Eisenbacteria bacterium]|nr:hypothetical protein [Candidatus Latescibacterota bacterium]MBD3301819.1 hypothetical protein [Candidatus Eisenbacteria bacterium]
MSPRLLRLASIWCWTILALSLAAPSLAEVIRIDGGSGETGLTILSQDPTQIHLRYEVGEFRLEEVDIDGQRYRKPMLPGVFLPNDAGAPDLPGLGRFVAIPAGAEARLEIVAAETRLFPDVAVPPAPVIPKETDDGPLVYVADPDIFGTDAAYPESPALLSAPGKIRGVDYVTVGITPFQYNPVRRELLVYTQLEVRVVFDGGTGRFGEDRLRNRMWEPILRSHLLNYDLLPPADLDRPRDDRDGAEYVIIAPDDPVFLAWADTIKTWRTLQGIDSEVFSTTEIGGNSVSAIESWLNDAYNTWDPAPAAFLILGDYPAAPYEEVGIPSPIWSSYCASDNIYADVDGDNMPDMVHARICARDESELERMIGKFLDYERTPPTNPGYYANPVIAGGWQTTRWFILCAEVCLGHQEIVLGKQPVREYAIYDGNPGGGIWSSNGNTQIVLDYFGPAGLGYIPSTPDHLTDWGGNATRINDDLNSGAYLLLHRDHGNENGWGEPYYTNGHLGGLSNEDLPFVFSMNCLTGKYNWSGECFTEAFHRMEHGALGLVAASEISYSFVNDCLVWGMFDTMWPDFMPDYGPYPPETGFATDLRPAFGMVSGKYFLQASNWPYNTSDKLVTYHLFHHHSDPFLQLHSEVPRGMEIIHDEACFLGLPAFSVQAELGAYIALTVDGEIIGRAEATGLPQDVVIDPQTYPGLLTITVTKPNCLRYEAEVPIIPMEGPYLVFDSSEILDSPGGDADARLDAGETVDLDVMLQNVGLDATSGVTATISSEDPYLEILVAERAFPDIPADSVRGCVEPYRIHLRGDAPDGHGVSVTVTAESNEGSWESRFGLEVEAPVLASGAPLIDDSPPDGNGSGVAEPGETIAFQLGIGNVGHSDATALEAVLACDDLFVQILDGEGVCLRVPSGGESVVGGFRIEILPLCPTPRMIPLDLSITGEDGFTAELDYEISVGSWFDDAEADRGWTMGIPTDDASTGRWVRADPIGTEYQGAPVQPEDDHTPDPASYCFVTANGSVGGGAGDADVDEGTTTLLTPVFDLEGATSATVSYWRWYTNDLGNNPGEDFWSVDVTNDGESWMALEETQESSNAWTHHEFVISDSLPMTGAVQLRFVAE